MATVFIPRVGENWRLEMTDHRSSSQLTLPSVGAELADRAFRFGRGSREKFRTTVKAGAVEIVGRLGDSRPEYSDLNQAAVIDRTFGKLDRQIDGRAGLYDAFKSGDAHGWKYVGRTVKTSFADERASVGALLVERPATLDHVAAVTAESLENQIEHDRRHVEALAHLDTGTRWLLHMRLVQKQDYNHIAWLTGETPTALRVRLHRAIKELSRLVEEPQA